MNLCECGCGEDPGVYVDTSRGHKKGQPRRFIRGHNPNNSTTHGMSRVNGALSPEYQSYMHAKCRCTDPQDSGWVNYGGRGIKFLFRSFEHFFAELGPKPEPKYLHSVDRIHNNGNYEPGNVRWATDKEQNNNQRPSVKHVMNLEIARLLRAQFATGKYRLFELAKMYGIKRETIAAALKGKTWKEKGEHNELAKP
jgi:hypothetical protein